MAQKNPDPSVLHDPARLIPGLMAKPGAVIKSGKNKGKFRMMAYHDARTVMGILDDAFGPDGWDFNVDSLELIDGAWICRATLRTVCYQQKFGSTSRSDIGTGEGNAEIGAKGAVSDALKRCAVHLGVGRVLYGDLSNQLAESDSKNERYPKYGESDRIIGVWKKELLAMDKPELTGSGHDFFTFSEVSPAESLDDAVASIDGATEAVVEELEPETKAEPKPEPTVETVKADATLTSDQLKDALKTQFAASGEPGDAPVEKAAPALVSRIQGLATKLETETGKQYKKSARGWMDSRTGVDGTKVEDLTPALANELMAVLEAAAEEHDVVIGPEQQKMDA